MLFINFILRNLTSNRYDTAPPIDMIQHEQRKIPVQVIDYCFKCVSEVIAMHYQATTFLTAPGQEAHLFSSVLALSTKKHKATEKVANFLFFIGRCSYKHITDTLTNFQLS